MDGPQVTESHQGERNVFTTTDSTPTFSPTADDVAGSNSMWLDPWSGELCLVPPGVHRKIWEGERIAARDRHKAAVHAALNPAPIGPPLDTMSSQDDDVSADLASTEAPDPASAPIEGPDLDTPFEAVQSQETSGPERPVHYDQMMARPPAPIVVRERVIVHERVEVGIVGWIREHPGAAHQAVAWVIAAVLIGIASLG